MADMFGSKMITQYERGIVFRWGRALPGIREPRLTWVSPFADRLRKVNMQIIVAAVPGQEAITRDNVSLQVDAARPDRTGPRLRPAKLPKSTRSKRLFLFACEASASPHLPARPGRVLLSDVVRTPRLILLGCPVKVKRGRGKRRLGNFHRDRCFYRYCRDRRRSKQGADLRA